MSAHVPRLRMLLLAVVVMGMFGTLTVRLYELQVVSSVDFEVQAEANRVRTIQVMAPRGRILDRNGTVIVDNRVASVVAIDRTEFRALADEDREEMLERLAFELAVAGHEFTPEQIEARALDERFSTYAPVPIVSDIDEELRIYLAERSDLFPSVRAERTAIRTYPYGSLASNVLGYVGSINEDELAALEDEELKPYNLNDQIGKAGIELANESDLRGRPGIRQVEVDAEGNPVRIINEVLPQPGSDVYLTIDIDVQAMTQLQLEQGLERARENTRADKPPNRAPRGAVVVQEVTNGQILAMASYPTYDPREFVNGISQDQWAELNDPENHYPLNNWAIQGQWAPGSTFKLFTAYAGLAGGVIDGDTPYFDSGGYFIPGCTQEPCTVANSNRQTGPTPMREALRRSSNAYFANIGGQFWMEREQRGGELAMQQHMALLGIGERSGIPLAYEAPGRLPSSEWEREWCAEMGCEPYWGPGHNAHMAIGQGSVLVTPLQLVNGYATVANGGTRFEPQIVGRVEPPDGDALDMSPRVVEEVYLPPEVRDPIHEGLMAVTTGGTASGAFAGFPLDEWPVAGKTGTGEFETKANTATFVAYGPADAPRYAISVVMEESDFGGTAAAPVARALFDVLAGFRPLPETPLGGELELTEEDELITVEGAVD